MSDPALSALLRSWGWRLDVIIVLALAGTIYTWGWVQLRLRRRRTKVDGLATEWRLAFYWAGLIVIALALMSPIDTLGNVLFTFHMVQHLLLIMIAPPLLLLANPFPFFAWSLSKFARPVLSPLLNQKSTFRSVLETATKPGVALLLFVITYIGWHDPNAYNLALKNEWVHDFEHLTFFATAMLFWWHVTQAGPHIHKRFSVGMRVGYIILNIPPNMLTGVTIAFASQPIYTHYTTVARVSSLTVMEDQMLGGIIMWVPGSMMYIIAILILVAGVLSKEEAKPPLPDAEWSSDEAMLAPGWGDKE